MFRVIYNKEEVELSSVDKVIELITRINSEKLVDKQLVVVESEYGTMEIGLGMGSDSVLFFIPVSEDEDIKVSCNELVDRAKTDIVEINHVLDEEVECTSCNIVPLESAIMTLEAFLQAKEFTNFVDWYSY